MIWFIEHKLRMKLDKKRFDHTLSTVDMAVELARHYHINEEQAKIAALLHDCAKGMDSDALLNEAQNAGLQIDWVQRRVPKLLHGPVGAVIAKRDFGVTDPEILDAITYHTTGRNAMTPLDKIIYLADAIELRREYSGVEKIRETAMYNLDDAIIMAMDYSIRHSLDKRAILHNMTVEARNDILKNEKREDKV